MINNTKDFLNRQKKILFSVFLQLYIYVKMFIYVYIFKRSCDTSDDNVSTNNDGLYNKKFSI